MSSDNRENRGDSGAGRGPEGTPEVDLSVEFQEELIEFARRMPGGNYYSTLGLSRDATPDQIREAFAGYSKKFHPDRFFGRKVGGFAGLLHQIYKRIVVAHEVLRDAGRREAYDRALRALPGPGSIDPDALRAQAGSLQSRTRAAGARVLADLRSRVQRGRGQAPRSPREFPTPPEALAQRDREESDVGTPVSKGDRDVD